jgi:hypothetical protein
MCGHECGGDEPTACGGFGDREYVDGAVRGAYNPSSPTRMSLSIIATDEPNRSDAADAGGASVASSPHASGPP